ncbi:MAG: phytase, partial [Pseudomonadales bacterium]
MNNRFKRSALCLIIAFTFSACDRIKDKSLDAVNCTALAVFPSDGGKPQPDDTVTVFARAETEPVTNACDAADDPAIWANAESPADSKIVISNKVGKIAVHALAGETLYEARLGRMNNVDLREHVMIDNQRHVVVASTNRSKQAIEVYSLDRESGELRDLAEEPIIADFEEEIYGICLYHSKLNQQLYAFINDKEGNVAQWQLTANDRGKFTGRKVRAWPTGVETEGCVVDDANAWLHLGAQNDGIWRYDAEPDASTEKTIVDTTGVEVNSGGRLAG